MVRVDLFERVGQEEDFCCIGVSSINCSIRTTLDSQSISRDSGYFQNLAVDQDVKGSSCAKSNTTTSRYVNRCNTSST